MCVVFQGYTIFHQFIRPRFLLTFLLPYRMRTRPFVRGAAGPTSEEAKSESDSNYGADFNEDDDENVEMKPPARGRRVSHGGREEPTMN